MPRGIVSSVKNRSSASAFEHVERRHFVGEVAQRDGQIVVVAKPGRVDAHAAGGEAGGVQGETARLADLFERAVALVAEQEMTHRVVGDEDIEPAVVVEIDKRDSQRLCRAAYLSPDR